MKRKELWELLGEVPADMIEEASVPRKGNRVLWLRRWRRGNTLAGRTC